MYLIAKDSGTLRLATNSPSLSGTSTTRANFATFTSAIWASLIVPVNADGLKRGVAPFQRAVFHMTS